MEEWIKSKTKGDLLIWGIMILLSAISTLAVYSATGSLAYRKIHGNTEYYLIKHLSLVLMSFFMMWLTHQIDFRYYIGISKIGLWISVPLLLFTWKHGSTINEASRWITIPIINKTFQPSDLAQFCLIGQLANILAKRQDDITDFRKAFLPSMVWVIIISSLVALTNFSGAILLIGTSVVIMFIAGISLKHIGSFFAVGIVAGILVFSFGQRGGTAKSRITSFLKGETSFQSQQSQIAIASGKFYGKGPGNSTQRNFLPHPYSDFIFAILVEEYGFIGGAFVLLLYLLLLLRGISYLNDKILFGGLLSTGLSFLLVFQSIINIGVTVGILPVTGLTLPFVSMGGTSLIFTGITVGAILSVSRGKIESNLRKSPKNNKSRSRDEE